VHCARYRHALLPAETSIAIYVPIVPWQFRSRFHLALCSQHDQLAKQIAFATSRMRRLAILTIPGKNWSLRADTGRFQDNCGIVAGFAYPAAGRRTNCLLG
jgi:hypothetical protein